MFRKLLGFGLLVLLVTSLFGGLSGRSSRAAYYEGYEAGLQAQTSAEVGTEAADGSETAVSPPAAPHGYGRGHDYNRSFSWGAWGILGIFAIFFKIGFFFLLLMLIFRLLGPRRWRHRAHWHRGPWGHHHKHGHGSHRHHSGHEKSPKWMDDSDDDEPVMTV
ncbi:MAG: hypothetical protein GY805_21115 [Chloroflexi bacterium]|nr:hypothetical protein [Chloroflexota bacterium]